MIIEYRNQEGTSGIRKVDIADSHVDIEFKSGGVYRYTESSVGTANLVVMKTLAKAGRGLNRFINKHVRYKYQERTAALTSEDATQKLIELLSTGQASLLVN